MVGRECRGGRRTGDLPRDDDARRQARSEAQPASVTATVRRRGVFSRNVLRRAIVPWHTSTMGCNVNGACVISSSFVHEKAGASPETAPSGCGMTSGCAGCGSIPGSPTSGRLDPMMCACRRKGRHATPAIGGSPMSVPERPSSTYVPPPPPAKQSDVKRPPLATAPPAPPRMDVPSNGGNAFIPPPPAMK